MSTNNLFSDELFALAFRLNPAAISLSEIESGELIDINDEFCNIFSYTREEILEKKSLDFDIYGDEQTRELFKELILSGAEIRNIITKSYKRNGELFWASISGEIIKVQNRNCFMCVTTIVTDLIETQQALIEKEHNYQLLANNITDTIARVDENNKVVFCSPSVERLLGFTEQEMQSLNAYDLIHKEDIPLVTKTIESLRLNNTIKTIEFRAKTKKGRYIWVEAAIKSLIDENNNKFIGYLTSTRDISKRKITEDLLQKSEERYKFLFAEAPIAFAELDFTGIKLLIDELTESGITSIKEHFLINNDVFLKCFTKFNIIEINIEMREMLKIGHKEFSNLPETLVDIFNESTIDALLSAFEKMLKGDYFIPSEHTLLDFEGNLIYSKSIFFVPEGYRKNWSKVLLTCDDITFKVLAEKQILESREKLFELNAMKDKFFSIISHDLKNPLSSIIALSNLCKKDSQAMTLAEYKEAMLQINQTSDDLFNMLENLLEWSLSQMDKINYDPQLHLLSQIVNNSISILRAFAEKKNISIESNVNNNIIILADETMMLTVIRNLISNAIKFSTNNCKIKIDARITEQSKKQKQIVVSVTDNGVGISEKRLGSLFQFGNNISTLGTENEKGSGLGLIICKEFIEKNKGKIWIESELGKGTTIYFTVPVIDKFI